MTSFQKIIKYCANTFAIFLIIGIIGGASSALLAITGISTIKDRVEENKESVYIEDENNFQQLELSNKKVEKLKIDVLSANIVIRTGKEFSVKYSGVNFDFEQKDNKLEIENESDFSSVGQLLITVPEKMAFKKFTLNSGAGNVSIENLACDELDLDLGAGQTNIDYLAVKKEGEIDTGVGKMDISSGVINNLEASLGVGQSVIKAELKGKSKVDSGIGKLNLILVGDGSAYTLKTKAGIGELKIDGEKLTGNKTVGNGENYITIENGIGAVDVRFE